MEKNTLTIQQIEALWHQYRDEEHRLFTDQEWADYKTMFKRGVNFPDWLRSLQPADAPAEPNPYDCPDCREAMRLAYSDATTPGFFFDRCARHRKEAECSPKSS